MVALTDEVLKETVAVFEAEGSQVKAARALGIARETLQGRLRRAAERGLMGTEPVLEGFRISKTTAVYDAAGVVVREFVQQKPERGEAFVVPDGQRIKGISALVDPEGREIVKWVKTGADPGAVDVAASLRSAFADYEPRALPLTPPLAPAPDLCTLIPCNDWHVGMFAWERETGTNWDLRIAESIILPVIEDVIARSPSSAEAIVLGGGDLTHADDNSNETRRSHNKLDVDGRHQKVVETAARMMARTIDAALQHHARVIVRILKGNHDEETAPMIAWFLLAWYRNEPRVTVDCDLSLFFFHRFGKVLIGATHGHAAKLADMPMIMANRRPEDWGVTQHRYAHGFHVHHKTRGRPIGGVFTESHEAPIPPDGWHFGKGYLSGQSIQSITYHAERGEWSRLGRTVRFDASL